MVPHRLAEADRTRIPCVRGCTPVWLLASICATAIAPGADAANEGNAPSSDVLQEVVVSSTRQGEQSLQDTPMAIFVVSPTDLDEKGLAGISELARTLPSVNMQSQSPGVNDIEMRGLVTKTVDATTLQDRSLTAVYLDEAPISLQTANPDLRVYDLERIEVLPGPQGTLYGAGSMAGTIRLITRKPDARDLFGSGDASVSSTSYGGTNYAARGVLNLPLVADSLAVRVAGYRAEDSGFIDNVIPGFGGKTRLSLDYTYRSGAFTEFNQQDLLNREIPSSSMLNASLGYSMGRWELALFGTNLTNNALISSIIAPGNNAFIPGDKAYVGRPRTVGVRLHMDF